MSNGAAKWRSFVTLLLSAFILAASLDRLPDPPAVKPHLTEAKAISLAGQLNASCDWERKWARSVAAALVVVRWFDLEKVFATPYPLDGPTLLRHASDSSPPTLTA
jgi:hypothetical protein